MLHPIYNNTDDKNANFTAQKTRAFSKSLPNLASNTEQFHLAGSKPEPEQGPKNIRPPSSAAHCEGKSEAIAPANANDDEELVPANDETNRSPNALLYWQLQYGVEERRRESDTVESSPSLLQPQVQKPSEIIPSHLEVHKKYIADATDRPRKDRKRKPRRILDFIIFRPANMEPVYHVDAVLLLPPSRTKFICKIMCVKLVKWFMATLITLISVHIPHYRVFARERIWIVSVPTFIYASLFTLLRSCPVLLTSAFCSFAFITYTVCLSFIGSVIYSAFCTTLIPTLMITLVLFYGAAAVLSGAGKMDLTRDTVVPVVLLLDMTFSLLAFLASLKITGHNEIKMAQLLGSIWFPALMMMQALSLMELAELKAIVDGIRIDLRPKDWIIVGAYLF